MKKADIGDLVQVLLTDGKRCTGNVKKLGENNLVLDNSKLYEASYIVIPYKLIFEVEERIKRR